MHPLINDIKTAFLVLAELPVAALRRSDESLRPEHVALFDRMSGRGGRGAADRVSRRGSTRVNLAVFGATFGLFFAGARELPFKEEDFERRTDYLIEHRDRFETVIIGSSRIRRCLPVKRFDEVLREYGMTQGATFNLGIVESLKHHDFYTIRQILDAGVQPKYLVIEASAFTSRLRGPHIRRFEVWHDWEETVRVLESTREEVELEGTDRNRLERAAMHLGYYVKRQTPFGKGFRVRPNPGLRSAERNELEATHGYDDLDRDHDFEDEAYSAYLDDPGSWDARLSELDAFYEARAFQRPVNVEAFRDLHARVKSMGIQLVYLGTAHPDPKWIEPILWLKAEGEVVDAPDGELTPVLINLNTTEREYLRDLELRYDGGHTNNEGSLLFAEDLARAWVDRFGKDQDAGPGGP